MNYLAKIPRELPSDFQFEYDGLAGATNISEVDRHKKSIEEFIHTLMELGYTVYSWRCTESFAQKWRAIKK